jgi:hypothetical protein
MTVIVTTGRTRWYHPLRRAHHHIVRALAVVGFAALVYGAAVLMRAV